MQKDIANRKSAR